MTDTHLHCARCGAALPRADAVCQACDQALQPAEVGNTGRYQCPLCGQAFQRVQHALWPAGARWYTPRRYKPQCPHCHGFLRDRRNPPVPVPLVLLLVAAALAARQWLPPAQAKGALAVLLLVYAVDHFRRRERQVPQRQRFAPDDAGSAG